MKKYFLITIAVAVFAFVFSGCEKESTDSQTTSLKSLNIKDITVKDGMLCFDSWDQYESTLNSLAQACESYVSLYIDSISAVLGTDNEDSINAQIERDGFSQFKPLHDFADALHFNSLYNLLETAETVWMDDPSATSEDNPFNNTILERYQTALHNEYGDVMVQGEVFNPDKSYKKQVNCSRGGMKTNNSDTLYYNEKYRFIRGKLSTTAISFSASTTLYQINHNNKARLWYCKGAMVSMSGEKTSACEDGNPVRLETRSKCKTGIALCYVSVYETIKQQPNYIYPYENRLFSSHGVQYTELHLALGLK